MKGLFAGFILSVMLISTAFATTRDAQLTNTTGYNYNYMYPYLSNDMRTNLNPGVTTSQSTNPINTVVRTTKMPNERRVVPRPSAARSATSIPARYVQTSAPIPARTANNTQRRVVARSGITTAAKIRAPQNTGRVAARSSSPRAATPNTNKYIAQPTQQMSSARCMADYTECMNMYCERTDTPYNRCYCSAKLSQIDAKYQNNINNLIMQILSLKQTNHWTDDEMNQYWMATVGKYTDTNSWSNIDDALDINWADMDSRVRGQNAFTTGHEYCVQHLQGCAYMLTNLRDAYRSEIARDCAAYEQSLQKIQQIAETVISVNE